jgi:hypothetical protein
MANYVCHCALAALLAAAALGSAGCKNETSDEHIARSTKAVTGSIVERVLGFENAVGDWKIVDGGQGTLTNATDHTQGEQSLAVTARGYVPIRSATLTSLGTIGDTVQYDIQLPLAQPNPYWFGDTQLFVDIPSMGINNYYVGLVPLTGLPLGDWTTVTFATPTDLQTGLSGTYNDLTFKLVLNVPNNATGTYRVDNLRTGYSGQQVAVTAQLGCGIPATDAKQNFQPATPFVLPSTIPVTGGSAGTGTATLTIARDSTCTSSCTFTCYYKGASSQSHPVTRNDILLGSSYYFVYCDNGFAAAQEVLASSVTLHLASGDCQATSPTTATIVQDTGQAMPATPVPSNEVPVNPHGFDPPLSPDDPTANWPPDGGLPYDGGVPPDPPEQSNPEVDGTYTPQLDEVVVPYDIPIDGGTIGN